MIILYKSIRGITESLRLLIIMSEQDSLQNYTSSQIPQPIILGSTETYYVYGTYYYIIIVTVSMHGYDTLSMVTINKAYLLWSVKNSLFLSLSSLPEQHTSHHCCCYGNHQHQSHETEPYDYCCSRSIGIISTGTFIQVQFKLDFISIEFSHSQTTRNTRVHTYINAHTDTHTYIKTYTHT